MAFYKDLNYLKPAKGEFLEDLDAIMQRVYSILGTKKGQRVFRPGWGGSLDRYLFEPCDELTASSMLYDITQTVQNEGGISLDMSKTFVTPIPESSQMEIQLYLDLPGFSEFEKTITLTFKQKSQGI